MTVSDRTEAGLCNSDLLASVDTQASHRLRLQRWRFGDLDSSEAAARFNELGQFFAGVATPSLPVGTGWAAEGWCERWDNVASSTGCSAHRGSELVGFMLVGEQRIAGLRALHLQSAYVHPALQGRGIGFALNARLAIHELTRYPLGSRWAVASFINPIALAGFRARLSSDAAMYPRIDGGTPNPELVDAARAAAAELYPKATFDPLTGVLHGRHRPRATPVPTCGAAEVDDYFARHVDPGAGDVLLAVFDARRPEVLRGARQVPGAFLRSLKPKAGRTRRDDP
jgi:ribosomal protein S18 acetylase RimI-like enzyme